MFPLGDRDLPDVEHKILSYVGSRDLVSVKLVSKEWYRAVRRYLNHLKRSKNQDELMRLLRESLLEPVSYFATIHLPRIKRDLCFNKATKEVNILSDEAVLQLDINKLHVAKEMSFPRIFRDKWRVLGRLSSREISAGTDGQFEVKQEAVGFTYSRNGVPTRRSLRMIFKRTQSGNLLEHVGTKRCVSSLTRRQLDFYMPYGRGDGYYDTYLGTTAVSKMAVEIDKFCRNQLNPYWLCDVAWLEDKSAAVFSVSFVRSGWSKLYGIKDGGEAKLIATIPMVSANLHIVGTRVVCHSKENQYSIIVLDVWNPESVRQEGVKVMRM